MTMEEIDRRRAYLEKARAEVKRIHATRAAYDDARLAVVAEEESVEEALREWWAQGCKGRANG
jgi:hypothetical protein